MKLNWGKSIVLAIILFIGFIMFMVIQMTTQKEFDHDLVVDEYYKKEMTLNDKLEKLNNGKTLENKIKFVGNANGLLLTFPEELIKISDVNLYGYRASDKGLDFKSAVTLNDNAEALVKRPLKSGPWEFTLAFSLDSKEYLVKKIINIQ
jgi:hypothetical protein